MQYLKEIIKDVHNKIEYLEINAQECDSEGDSIDESPEFKNLLLLMKKTVDNYS